MIRVLPLILGCVFVSGCATSKPQAPLIFDYARRGDDGLTNRIGEAIVNALEASREFASRKTDTELPDLQLLIDGHATWRIVDGRTDASVTLEVRRSGMASSTSIRCYSDETVACGRAALEFVRQNSVR